MVMKQFKSRTRCLCVFFFSSRRRHTRCLSDWSSDVCSSDLIVELHPTFVHRFEAYRLVAENLADVGALVSPVHAPLLGDVPGLHFIAILQLRHVPRIAARTCLVAVLGSAVVQRLVRPLLVVLELEFVKCLLLQPSRRLRRLGGGLLQRAVHAFVPPVVLRTSRPAAFRHDAQSHKPHGQPAQPTRRHRREGQSVMVNGSMRVPSPLRNQPLKSAHQTALGASAAAYGGRWTGVRALRRRLTTSPLAFNTAAIVLTAGHCWELS